MSVASLTFTLPDESHEFKAAANAGSLVSVLQDLENEFRRREKYGKASERRLTAGQVREMLRSALREHDAEWALL